MTELAYNSHLRCVTLAQTLIPRNLSSYSWYVISRTFAEQHRGSKQSEEEAVDSATTEHIRAELEPILTPLNKAAAECTQDFLAYIYTTHPPRKDNATIGSIAPDQLGATMKRAICHYHPDAQSTFNDTKWTFLCSEITKILNAKYGLIS